MTIDISNNAARINYTVASGVTQTSFSVPFEFFNDGDLSVYVDDVLKTITTHYTVSGGDGSTGTITMSVTGAAGGSTVVISRSIAIERTSDFQTGVDINRAALNTQLDTLTAIAADNQDKASRSISAPNSEVNPVLELPDADTRKGKLIGFNETTGNIELSATLADGNTLASISGDIATLADIEDGTDATDAIQTVAGISSNVTTVAGVSANVTTVAGNTTNINTVAGNNANITTVAGISTDVTTVSGISSNVTSVAGNETNINTVAADGTDIGLVADDITNVNTVATNIASVNTNAANITDIQNASANAATATTQAGIATTKASEAATSKANAATSETNAATSETNASTSETNAATSATNAASSATNAAGSASAALNFQTQAGIYSSNAASSASSALSSKNSASSFATNSANSATSASNSASTATTKASEAAASETAAEAAKVAAEAALDEFTDIYLGAKASDPTTDNDGNALTAGDQYFNTTINVLKIYNGSAWQAAAIDSSGFVETTGDTMTGNLSFGDNDKAIFGAGSDLQIYHNGTNQDKIESSSSFLILEGSNIILRNNGGTEDYAKFFGDGAVELYSDNSKKLATTSTGIDVTGTVTADGLTVGDGTTGDHTIDLNGAGSSTSTTRIHFQGGGTGNPSTLLSHSASSKDFTISTGNLDAENTRFEVANNGDISFYEDTGTTPKFFWDASAESLGIGTSSPTAALDVRRVDADGKIAEFHQSTGYGFTLSSSQAVASIESGFLQDFVFKTGSTATERMRIDSSGNVGIGTDSPGVKFVVANGADAAVSTQIFGADETTEYLGFGQNGAQSVITAGSAGAQSVALVFRTAASGAETERMRIDSSGRVGIGTTSPATSAAGTVLKLERTGSTRLNISAANVSYSAIDFGDTDDVDVGRIEYYHANNAMFFHTNAAERMRIDSSGNLLVGQTSLNYNTIGGSLSAGGTLRVCSNSYHAATFNRKTSDGDIAIFYKDGTTVGSIASQSSGTQFSIETGGGNEIRVSASGALTLEADREGNAGGDYIDFRTAGSEAMRIDSSGNLLVGKTSTSINTAGSRLIGGGAGAQFTADGTEALALNRLTNDGDLIWLGKAGTKVGSIGVSGSDITTSASGSAGGLTWDWQSSGATRKFIAYQNALRPNTANNGAIDLGSDTGKWRDLYLSGGVYLGGTGAANKLDDYEEGTWTPTLSGSSTTGSYTYSSRSGSYTKIGRAVHFVGSFTIGSVVTAAAGSWRVSGMPYSADTVADSGNRFNLSLYGVNFDSVNQHWIQGYFSGATYLQLIATRDGTSWTIMQPGDFSIGVGDIITVSGTYTAA